MNLTHGWKHVVQDSGRADNWLTDDQGRRWAVERIGRTSGTVATKPSHTGSVPADLVRFTCESDPSEPIREVTVPVGHLDGLSRTELKSLFDSAPRDDGG